MSGRSHICVVCGLLAPIPLSAQAALAGRIREDSTKTAVAGVEILIQASNKITTTDTAGRFVLGGLAHGIHSVVVRSIGYRPIALRAYLVTDDTLEVDLLIEKTPVELAPLEVTASAVPIGLDAFERRRLDGWGTFVDWTTLRKQEYRPVSDIFRGLPGVRIRYNRNGQAYLASSRGNCPMQIYLDGIPIYKPGGPASGSPPVIDQFSTAQLDAIEVYRGSSETPVEFSGRGAGCGTVLLWSRRH